MKKIILLCITVSFSILVFAQSPNWIWAKGIGGTNNEGLSSIAADAAGNVYLAGAFRGSVDFDPGPGTYTLTSDSLAAFILKVDASGNFQWARAITGDQAFALSIAVSSSGNVYTLGYFWGLADLDPGPATQYYFSYGAGDIFISKLDASGNYIWSKRMGGASDNLGYAIYVDAVENVYSTGYFFDTCDFNPGLGTYNLTAYSVSSFVSKLDANGNFVWAKAIGDSTGATAYNITGDAAGNVYFTGSYWGTIDFDPGPGTFYLTSAGGSDVFIDKLDASGNFLWAKSVGGTSDETAYSIASSPSGDIYFTGTFVGTADFDPGPGVFNLISAGGGDIFTARLDASGNFAWAKSMGGTGNETGFDIGVSPAGNGNILTVGGFAGTVDFDGGPGTFNLTSQGLNDLYIICMDANGNFIWAKQGGGTLDEGCSSVAFSALGNIYVGGNFQSNSVAFGSTVLTNSSAGSSDIFIAKLDTLVAGINETEIESSVRFISPNPATNEFKIYHLPFTISEIEIYNVLGEKCLTPPLSKGEGVGIDISSLQAGIYFLKVRGEKEERVAKFVKQ